MYISSKYNLQLRYQIELTNRKKRQIISISFHKIPKIFLIPQQIASENASNYESLFVDLGFEYPVIYKTSLCIIDMK